MDPAFLFYLALAAVILLLSVFGLIFLLPRRLKTSGRRLDPAGRKIFGDPATRRDRVPEANDPGWFGGL